MIQSMVSFTQSRKRNKKEQVSGWYQVIVNDGGGKEEVMRLKKYEVITRQTSQGKISEHPHIVYDKKRVKYKPSPYAERNEKIWLIDQRNSHSQIALQAVFPALAQKKSYFLILGT